jgi:hypothetical protein
MVDNPGPYGETRYEFEWEREWRVPHHLSFNEGDVAFLLAPEHYHDWMRRTAWRELCASDYQGVVLGTEHTTSARATVGAAPGVRAELLDLLAGLTDKLATPGNG